jgi:hypothetical protein
MNEGCGRKIACRSNDFDEPYACCTIIRDDCRKHLWNLPRKSFDLVVTDPPYGMGIGAWQKHHEKVEWDGSFPVNSLIRMRVLSRLGAYYFCRWDNLWNYQERMGSAIPNKLAEHGNGLAELIPGVNAVTRGCKTEAEYSLER